MGSFANRPWVAGAAWVVTVVIIGLNLWLLVGFARDWLA
jgi:Mn2+/Fe2+ NRAMP family transporter